MKNLRFGITIALLLNVIAPTLSTAQPYFTNLGVRLFGGNGTGISVVQRIQDGATVEAIGQLNSTSYQLSGLAKIHNKILFSRIANYYLGVGGHYGGYTKELDAARTTSAHFYGANIMLGTELTLGRFNIGVDYMPSYMIARPTTEDNALRHDVTVSLRIVLIKPKKSKGLFDGLDKILKDAEGGGKKSKTKEM